MTTFLIVAGVVLLVGYRLSLTLHPYVNCRRCKGRSRHTGFFFSYARRPCHICFGSGTRQRLGARLLGLGTPMSARPWGRFAPRASEFAPPTRPKRFLGIF